MIQLVRYIEENRTICTANDTYLEVRGTGGATHFIEAQIFINNVYHSTQIWSKKDEINATRNIVNLYRNEFINEFAAHTASGFLVKENLRKKVDIKLNEINIATSNTVDTVDLPTFYIIPGNTPFSFNSLDAIAVLDNEIDTIPVNTSSPVVISTWISSSTDVTVQLINPNGSVFHTDTYAVSSANNIHEIVVLLSDHTITTSFLTLRISQGSYSRDFVLSMVSTNVFDSTIIYAANNLEQYIPYTVTGRLTVDHELEHEIYRNKKDQLRNYNLTDNVKLSLLTGNRNVLEKEVIAYLATSKGAVVLLDNEWKEVSNETSKYNRFEDRKFIYTDTLTYRYNNIASRDNSDAFPPLPEAQNLVFDGVEDRITYLDFATIEAAIIPTSPLADGIYFDSLPSNGRLYVNDVNNYSFLIVAGVLYNFSDWAYFFYVPTYQQFGMNLESLDFRLVVNTVVSAPAVIAINIAEDTTPGRPPVVNLIDAGNEININGGGTSTQTFVQTLNAYDPEGGPLTYLWEVITGSNIATITNETTNSVSIDIYGAAVGQTVTLSVTVTDQDNMTTQRTVSYNLVQRSMQIGSSSSSSIGGSTSHNISIIGAVPNSSVAVEHQIIGSSINQSAIIDTGAANTNLLMDRFFNAEYVIVETDGDGAANYTITTQDPEDEAAASLRVNIAPLTEYDIVPGKNEITLQWKN